MIALAISISTMLSSRASHLSHWWTHYPISHWPWFMPSP